MVRPFPENVTPLFRLVFYFGPFCNFLENRADAFDGAEKGVNHHLPHIRRGIGQKGEPPFHPAFLSLLIFPGFSFQPLHGHLRVRFVLAVR